MDTARHVNRGRRQILGAGIAVGSTAVAGCLGSIGDDIDETSDAGSYTVSLDHLGETTFDAIPNSAFVTFPQYADMAIALGHGEAVQSLFATEMAGTTMDMFYDHLEGVDFEWETLDDPLADGLTKEELYAYDCDVHFLDPSYVLLTESGWTESEIDEIGEALGPWYGSFHSGVHSDPADAYAETYEYRTLWELFETVAEIFQERDRYEALAAVYDDVYDRIESTLPPEDERPTVARVTLGDGEFFTYHLNTPGFWQAETRPLGAHDALAEYDWSGDWGTVDYETLLEVDPDVILHLWGITPRYAIDDVRDRLADHSAGSTLRAVQNDRVVASGMRYQGPIMNLFQLEMTAKQLYPDQFGAWPGHTPGDSYPEFSADEQLFDRQRVATIITGTE
ncbi:ABC transporter substrate-binding protein [Natronorubrum aibiense]|uniref:ABC transporter substrate-binding protein n=1 Tax=Natronorubrum aibiense TaxID=348826 RepID=A0A5P9P3V9_9EURY|nr:ABC transporter substrate-binding protein [Natronorubrum aibiense]QFU82839.1 ABC transporter substrate-binding protein [Natronorubrum aibiense]